MTNAMCRAIAIIQLKPDICSKRPAIVRHCASSAYKTTPEGRGVAEAIQAMLQRVGIELDIHTNEWETSAAIARG